MLVNGCVVDMANIREFKKELKALLLKYEVGIGVDLEGDTHGLCTEFVVFPLKGHENLAVLAEHECYLTPGDL